MTEALCSDDYIVPTELTVIGTMAPYDLQETNERRFARKHINGYIDQSIRNNPENEAKVHAGVALLQKWMAQSYYASKNARIAQLASFDLEQLVRDIYVGCAYCQAPTLYVSITAQLASKLGFDDHADSIRTVAEVVAVLSSADAFDIGKASLYASLKLVNQLVFPQTLYQAIARSMYLPPLVCEPQEITNNFESPYLTFNECQILGKGNGHDQDICLDVINTQNRIPLRLDLEFLSTVEEEPSYALDTLEKLRDWDTFKMHSYAVYEMLAKQGNQFWLTNKPDKRGRLYSQGYHVNSQGTSFKKAGIELYDEEIVEGVPT
jgi:hypothetical protein